MKKILFAALLALGTTAFTNIEAQAQVSVNINIGNQPAWGPVGYDYVQYYYIPEYNIYYDVVSNRYIYMNNRRWIHAAMLPPHLRHIDLYRTHKVVLNQRNPYRYNDNHMRAYGRYRNDRNQMVLRDNRGYQQYRNNGNRPPQHMERGPRGGMVQGPQQRPNRPQQAPRHGHRPDRIAQNQPSQHRSGNGGRRDVEQRSPNNSQRGNGHNQGRGNGHQDRGSRR